MTIFEDLIPAPLPAGVKVLYGTVTGSSPLRVQVDRDPGPLPVTPTTTVACAVGDRVVMLSHVRADNPDARARAVVVVGVIGGDIPAVVDVSDQFTRTSGSPVVNPFWTARLIGGSVVFLTFACYGGWAGGTWASTKILNVPTALDPVDKVATMFPYHANVAVEVRTEGGIWLASSTGGLSGGTYYPHLTWAI